MDKEVICHKDGCGGECKFQGDVGDLDEWKCQVCGMVYAICKE
jgi:hypothetical protein